MKNNLKNSSESLRKQAEDFLNSQKIISGTNNSESASVQLIEELLACQNELKLQNQELLAAEKEFYSEREYYKDIFNNQPAGLYRIRVFPVHKWKAESWVSAENPPYIMELASDRFCEILGVSKQDFENNPYIIINRIYNDDKNSFIKRNEEANKKFIAFRWEGRLMINEDVKWVRLESRPRKLDNGEIIWTGILYDISERKLVEAELEESRLKLEDVLIGANVGSLEWNIQTGKIRFNEVWAKNLGYTSNLIRIGVTLFGKNGWKKLTHPDDISYAEEMLERHFSGELPHHSVEVRMKHRNGHWVWIRQEGKVKTWTPDGKPLLMYGTHTDISQRKKAEDELNKLNQELEKRVAIRTSELEELNTSLQQTEQKFRTVSDFTHDWEYWRSPENKIIYMSPSVERITGYSISEFENNPGLIDQIIDQNDSELWENHKKDLEVHAPNTNSEELTFRIVTKSGEIRWIGHVCRTIYIDGVNLGIRVSNRDITDKINAENELLGITIAVEERERNRFSRELHDGMGPLLSTIKLYFQWLSDTDDVEKKKLINEKGNQSIEAAIQTARELSRGLSSQHLTNSGYIIAIQDFVQRINDTNKIEIHFETNSTKRFNGFLETTLYRITTELLKNTLTYAQATNVEINFDFDKTKKKINFYYSDNGLGFKVDQTSKPYTGLGLMNIRQRVQILKGKIHIESKPTEGMIVSIQLPVEVV